MTHKVSTGLREGFVEVRFSEKPDKSVTEELKAAKFRFSSSNGDPRWYGKEYQLPIQYKGEPAAQGIQHPVDEALKPQQDIGHTTTMPDGREIKFVSAVQPKVTPQVPAMAGMTPLGAAEPTGIDKFVEVYTRILTQCVKEKPSDYIYSVAEVPSVVAKMRDAFIRDSYNHTGAAIKLACKELGIKHTRTAMNAFFASKSKGKPEPGKQYALTSKDGPSIANGNTWKESEVTPRPVLKAVDTIESNIEAFKGNVGSEDSAYITDGHMMMVKSALGKSATKMLSAVKHKGTTARFNHQNRVSLEVLEKMWKRLIDDCDEPAEFAGYLDTSEIGGEETEIHKYARLNFRKKHRAYFDAAKVKFILSHTDYDSVKSCGNGERPALFFKNGKPVATLMPIKIEDTGKIDAAFGRAASQVPEPQPESKPESKPETEPVAININLNTREKTVLGCMTELPMQLDNIITAANLPAHEVIATLLVLEVRRLVFQCKGKHYGLTTKGNQIALDLNALAYERLRAESKPESRPESVVAPVLIPSPNVIAITSEMTLSERFARIRQMAGAK